MYLGIAMAATLGMLVQENYHFVGYLSPSSSLQFTDVPNGLAAGAVVPLMGWVQMAVLIGAHEFIVQQRPGKAPGDFGTGYFGIALNDQSAVQLRGLTVEVQNGRLYVRVCVCV
jgi:Chlorophyll A-B binding protein